MIVLDIGGCFMPHGEFNWVPSRNGSLGTLETAELIYAAFGWERARFVSRVGRPRSTNPRSVSSKVKAVLQAAIDRPSTAARRNPFRKEDGTKLLWWEMIVFL